ncbi:MAG TPA: DsrE family protein [Gammaproteobacteria bacterium]|nr:DsrE family protein [Gammaproteobacteria bacterium]
MGAGKGRDDEQHVVILMTCGPSMPGRCATPFYIGAVLASMDARVDLFLTMEAVRLAERGVAESLVPVDGGKQVIEFIRDAKRVGVRLHVCGPALPGFQVADTADLIDEVDELSSGGALADLILSCDKVLTL